MDGFRIRELRANRGMTISELALATEVSAGLISQVERGRADPSLETLRKISRVLDVPLFELFEQEPDGGGVSVVRKDHQVRITSPSEDITYSRHSAGKGQLEVLRGSLKPGGSSSAEPWSHPAEECVVVVEGTLVAEVQGKRYSLAEGDSAHFNSRLPHRLLNEGDSIATFILAATPPSY
ncbi:MAG: cupin domain-containing protein [Cryobacterium sp.]